VKEGQYHDEIRQAWDIARKENAPAKYFVKKRKCERGKGLMGRELIEVIAFSARDSGMILMRKSPHRRSFYLKVANCQFRLRISDHTYSWHSHRRHMDVIVNFVASGTMDSKEAIEKGRMLFTEYKQERERRLKEASALTNGEG
jgi:hypothetical protein